MSTQQDSEFYAAAAEAHGGFNDQAVKLGQRICAFATRATCPYTRKELYSALISSLAVWLQIGNARCAMRVRAMNAQAGLAVAPLVFKKAPARTNAAPSLSASSSPSHAKPSAPSSNPVVNTSPAPANAFRVTAHVKPVQRQTITVISRALQQQISTQKQQPASSPAQPDEFGVVDEKATPLPLDRPGTRSDETNARPSVDVHARNADFDRRQGLAFSPLRSEQSTTPEVDYVLPTEDVNDSNAELELPEDVPRRTKQRGRSRNRRARGGPKRTTSTAHTRVFISDSVKPRTPTPERHSVQSVIVIPSP